MRGDKGAGRARSREEGALRHSEAPSSLKQDILKLLAKRPLDKAEIAGALRLEPGLRAKLPHEPAAQKPPARGVDCV